MRVGLRWRTAACFLAAVALSALFVAIPTLIRTRNTLRDREVGTALLAAKRVLNTAAEKLSTTAPLDELEKFVRAERLGFEIVLVDPATARTPERVRSSSPDLFEKEAVPYVIVAAAEVGRIGYVTTRLHGSDFIVVGGTSFPGGPMIFIFQPYEAPRVLGTLRRFVILPVLILLIAALVFGHLAAGRVLSPVRQAARVADLLPKNHQVRLPDRRGDDDFARLTRAFNHMADELGLSQIELQAKLEELTVANEKLGLVAEDRDRRLHLAAHDAHHVANRAKAFLAMASDYPAGYMASRATHIHHFLHRMSNLLASDHEVVLKEDPADIGDAVQTLLTRVTDDLGKTADFSCTGNLQTMVSLPVLRAVVTELVTNAFDHGEEPVSARVSAEPHWVRIDVADSGKGIPPGLGGVAFVAGFTTKPDHIGGLGFVILRELTQRVGWELSVDGAVFTTRIPRKEIPPELA